MVSIREAHYQLEKRYPFDQFDVAHWTTAILGITQPHHCQKIQKMWDFCFEKSAGSEKQTHCFQNSVEMVEILSTLNMDIDSLCAAFLFPFLEAKIIVREEILEAFDRDILSLVTTLIRMSAIKQLRAVQKGQITGEQIDSIRRMLLAMVNDFRSVVIKLAERIMHLRDLIDAPQEQQIIAAKECFSIYAPLANRLGIGQLKWEIEDFCFRYLHPDQYRAIARSLNEKRSERERYIQQFVDTLQEKINQEGIKAQVYGRPKHIYSIARKMEKKNLSFDRIFDLRAVRVICDEVESCYAVLGIIHAHYEHIAKEFDDYVANPKPNGYQSIHTIVYGPEHKAIEIQIRTEQMHQESELGVAAHWKYKEGGTDKKSAYDQRIIWLRDVLAWQQELYESGEVKEAVRHQVFDDRVYVFTPKGDVIDLPAGSTPLDFAYHIHSDVGHRCIGAKVGGRIVPFTTPLTMGDQVEIITQKQANPSRDWLNPSLGFLKSSRARAKIQVWFKQQDRDKNIAQGKQILEEMLLPMNVTMKEVEPLLIHRYNAHSFDEVLASMGSGDVRINQLNNFLNQHFNQPTAEEVDQAALKQIAKQSQNKNTKEEAIKNSHNIIVNGVGNLMVTMARCCRPIPGDVIEGFITQGRGISIHRSDCEQLQELRNHACERIVDAHWNSNSKNSFAVLIRVVANDRTGLLRDITTVFANEKVTVLDVNTRIDAKQELATLDFDVSLNEQSKLDRLLLKIEQIKDVNEAKRLHS